MVKITGVLPRSIAEKKKIKSGDTLVSINGNEINDVLDYRFYLTDTKITLSLIGKKGEYRVKIKKDEYDDLGLEFETPLMDKKHSCTNQCIFCFIDQNPEGMRDSIYFKDDDSRLSFIHGNYVTLTNMKDKDVERIIKMRISPVNISIHTTNPELRVKMMKNRFAGDVLRYLDDFKNAGLIMHGQIVLCKGVNDGDELRRTLSDLMNYYPNMESVSIVPAGLTKHRDGLYPLTDFTADEAREVIAIVDEYAKIQYAHFGTRQFFAADELYLKAEMEIPTNEYYEEYTQIENGVGMLRSFSDELDSALSLAADVKIAVPRRVCIVTGAASYGMISEYAEKINNAFDGLTVEVVKIVNNFFGESVTVSGLLTGKDIFEQMKDKPEYDLLLLPSSCLRHGDDLFLCGMSLTELSERLGQPVATVTNDGYCFLEAVLGVSLN